MNSGWISWSADDSEQGALSIDGRPVHVYWPLLRINFSGVLLDPIRHVGTGRVGWTWRQREEVKGPSADELSKIRIAIADALYIYASEQERGDANSVAGLYRGVENMMRTYAGMDDTQLARFAVITEYGLRLRSWGVPTPAVAVRHEPDAPGKSPESCDSQSSNDKIQSSHFRGKKLVALILVLISVVVVIAAILFSAPDPDTVYEESIRLEISKDKVGKNSQTIRRKEDVNLTELVGKSSHLSTNAPSAGITKSSGGILPSITPENKTNAIRSSQATLGFREVNGSGGIESSMPQSEVKSAASVPAPNATAIEPAPQSSQTEYPFAAHDTPLISEYTPQLAFKKNGLNNNHTPPMETSQTLPAFDTLGAKKPDTQASDLDFPRNEAVSNRHDIPQMDVEPMIAANKTELAADEAVLVQNPSSPSTHRLAPQSAENSLVDEAPNPDLSTMFSGMQKFGESRIAKGEIHANGAEDGAANGHSPVPHTTVSLAEIQDTSPEQSHELKTTDEHPIRSVSLAFLEHAVVRSVSVAVGRTERIRMLDMILPTWPSAESQADQVRQTKAEALAREQSELPVSLQEFEPECGWTLLLKNDASSRRNYTWQVEGDGWRHGIASDNKALIAWHLGSRIPTGKARLVDAQGNIMVSLRSDGISVALDVRHQDAIHESFLWIACRIHKSDTERTFKWISSTSPLLNRNIKQTKDPEFSVASLPISLITDSTAWDEQLIWYSDDAIWGVGLRLRIDVSVH